MAAGGEGGGGRVDVVAMTAAVADYRPAGVYRVVEKLKTQNSKLETSGQVPVASGQEDGGTVRETWVVERVGGGEGKVKSTFERIALLGERTEKLVDLFRSAWGFRGVLIKFKLEVGIAEEELVRVAEASRVASAADLIVANTLAMAQPTEGVEGAAYLIDGQAAVRVLRRELAGRLAGWAWEKLKTQNSKLKTASDQALF